MAVTHISTTSQKQFASQSLKPSSSNKKASLTITDTRCQTVTGFGGCFNEIGYDVLKCLPAKEQDKVMRSLFDRSTCDFNFCRLPIGASDYALTWYSHNEHDGDYAMRHFSIERDQNYLLPYIKKAQALRKGDLQLFASPWSPPSWMKTHKAFNYGILVPTKENMTAYALYFARFVEAYAKEGVTINQVHLQNEPVADHKFPSCLFTGAQMRDFIRDYGGPMFKKRGLSCEWWLGTINSDDYNGFANTALSDPKARQFIKGVGYQWAGKGAIARTHAAWPGIPVIQTENECGDGTNTWCYAHYIFELIQHYFVSGASAYVYWNMILPPEGASTWGWKQNAMITIDPATKKVTYNPEYYVMRHVTQFVKPGAVRLECTGELASNALGFVNIDGSQVVVVANQFDTPRQASIVVAGSHYTLDMPPASFHTIVVN